MVHRQILRIFSAGARADHITSFSRYNPQNRLRKSGGAFAETRKSGKQTNQFPFPNSQDLPIHAVFRACSGGGPHFNDSPGIQQAHMGPIPGDKMWENRGLPGFCVDFARLS